MLKTNKSFFLHIYFQHNISMQRIYVFYIQVLHFEWNAKYLYMCMCVYICIYIDLRFNLFLFLLIIGIVIH